MDCCIQRTRSITGIVSTQQHLVRLLTARPTSATLPEVFIHQTHIPSESTILLLQLPPIMTPPRRNIHSSWQSGSSSKLPVSRPLHQSTRSLPDRFEQAASEESIPRSRSGFQHWRNLPTTHHVDTNDTMESEENNEEPIGGDTPSNEKKNLTWDEDMDTYLIDLLTDQMHLGQKIGSSFSRTAYTNVAKGVSAQFGLGCSVSHIKNRIKTLKKNYALASTVLQVSGFGFNQSTQMVEADATVWERYILAHPDAKPLRYKPIQNYHRLDILFGKDRATGSLSIGPKERRLRSERQEHEETTADDRSTEQEQHNEVTSPLAGASISRATKKRKLRDYVSEEIKALKQGMDAVAAALDRGNPRNFTESELYSELRKVEGLKKVPAIEIYSKLAANISAARTFLGLPPEDRAIWLCVEFGSDIFDDPNVPF